MKNYTFYKKDYSTVEFLLSIKEIKLKFLEYLCSKGRAWVEHYQLGFAVQLCFINEPDGLNASMDFEDQKDLCMKLDKIKVDYLCKYNVN